MTSSSPLSDSDHAHIEALIHNHRVVLFMKGTPSEPRCGFSETVVRILHHLEVPFTHVDVLSDDSIRQGIKIYSRWPTIPQLYVDGTFVGGCDIIREEFQGGQLQERFATLREASASNDSGNPDSIPS